VLDRHRLYLRQKNFYLNGILELLMGAVASCSGVAGIGPTHKKWHNFKDTTEMAVLFHCLKTIPVDALRPVLLLKITHFFFFFSFFFSFLLRPALSHSSLCTPPPPPRSLSTEWPFSTPSASWAWNCFAHRPLLCHRATLPSTCRARRAPSRRCLTLSSFTISWAG
jgi:hypothetical protein